MIGQILPYPFFLKHLILEFNWVGTAPHQAEATFLKHVFDFFFFSLK